LYVLKNWTTLPNKSDFERKFPQSLRFDKDVVLTFCQRSDFETLSFKYARNVLKQCKSGCKSL
jgi:hypothetical protein